MKLYLVGGTVRDWLLDYHTSRGERTSRAGTSPSTHSFQEIGEAVDFIEEFVK